MSFFIVSFHFFIGLLLFESLTTNILAFTGVLSSSIFSMCPNHRNLCFFKNFFNFSLVVISRIVSIIMLSLSLLPHIIRSILIFVYSLQPSLIFLLFKPNNQHHSKRHFLQNYHTCFLSASVTRLFYTVYLNFFHPHCIPAVTTSCTLPPVLKTSPKYKNFATFSNFYNITI